MNINVRVQPAADGTMTVRPLREPVARGFAARARDNGGDGGLDATLDADLACDFANTLNARARRLLGRGLAAVVRLDAYYVSVLYGNDD